MSRKISRRRFIAAAARATGMAALAMPVIAKDLYAPGRVAANDRITIGCIGLGGMGMGNMSVLLGIPQTRVLATCDVYEPHRERAKNRVDDTYGNQDCKTYNDFRELLDRDDIHAVLIATPDHWHTRIAISACEAGKDIYCQKPLTLTISEGKALVKAVRKYGRVFQVGSQQRSESNFRFACELVRSGRIGKVHTVKVFLPNGSDGPWEPDSDPPEGLDWDLYLGPAPKVPYNRRRFLWDFRWFFDYSGGQMTDWGAHHFDIAQWGLGRDLSGPVSVEGTGTLPRDGMFETYTSFNCTYYYEDGIKMIATNPEHGTRFEGSDGWVHVWRGGMETEPKSLMHETLGPNDVHLYESPGHEQDWINCIRTRKKPICDVEIGHRSVTCAHLGNIAMRLGRKLQWDPIREEFVNDPEANRWLSRPYRAPWYL
ncbi:MAG TPA: Gfo/Idh/MocA family oxidoreductase [bacterium]|nr:Gfo/Idh/MocA family oxidoreductase [Candidatus Omnitrophota bacterium]HOJ61203.1 Gfo/Idh/MocA family oxidoreductase [bacterium]HOL93719.1 Gfo/Idh/MocA family oxidoreductase [bacterium]HPP00349.1 Gfo/Idh/MocA family oxidoreductase [bacterium]HXK93718.1 Gfo/Idh/MocA family oxidoreductase [bacterium]